MSLSLLLLALQAETPSYPPPLKVKPVVPVQPSTKAPAPKVNPTIIYTPAVKASPPAAPAVEQAASQETKAIGLSKASLERVLAERTANAERQARHKQQLAAVQDAVDKALAAEPFDLAALKAALVERDRITTSYREKLTEAVLDMLEAVPAEERLAVAKAVIKGELPTRAAEATPPPQPKPSPAGR